MTTEHLLVITSKGKVKVAQHGHFDGYLQGVGQDILEKMRDIVSTDERFSSFVKKVDSCEFLECDESELDESYDLDTSWASEIIDIIDDSNGGLQLLDSSYIKEEGECDYVYEINLDNKLITVKKSFCNIDNIEDVIEILGLDYCCYMVIKVYDLNNLTLSTSEPLTDK